MRGNRFTIKFPTFKATFGTHRITVENKRGVIARITTTGIEDPEPAYVYSYNALGYITKMINRYTAVNRKSGIQYKFKNYETIESDLMELRNVARKYGISL